MRRLAYQFVDQADQIAGLANQLEHPCCRNHKPLAHPWQHAVLLVAQPAFQYLDPFGQIENQLGHNLRLERQYLNRLDPPYLQVVCLGYTDRASASLQHWLEPVVVKG